MGENNTSIIGTETQLNNVELPYPLASYITVGTLGMFVWDVMVHLSTEYELLLKQKIRLSTLVYFWARWNTLVVLVSYSVLFTAPLDEYCPIVAKLALAAISPLISATSFLIFLRTRAFYSENRIVMIALFLSLLVAMGTSTLAPLIGDGEKIYPNSPYCKITRRKGQLIGAVIGAEFLYNLAAFLAISAKLVSQAAEEATPFERDNISKLSRFLSGKRLLGLSRTLWQDGQKYMLVYLVTTLIDIGVLFTIRLPETYGCALGTIHIALDNVMSSYLIRSVRTAALRRDLNLPTTLDLRTQPNAPAVGPGAVGPGGNRHTEEIPR